MRIQNLFLGMSFLLMVAGNINAASFDCEKATSQVEKLICGNDELARLDESLNEAHRRALERPDMKPRIEERQQQWLKNVCKSCRFACRKTECLRNFYETRIKEVNSLLAMGDAVESLHAAAKTGDLKTIRKLIAEGADVDAVRVGGTPLLTAINWNNFEAVKVLIAHGGNVNFKVGQWTPLMQAVGRDTRIVKLLIESGSDVNYADPIFGYTPLCSAANNRLDAFEHLTKSGGYRGPFPNPTETVRLLIAAGANLDPDGTCPHSPLRTAIRANNTEIIRLLLEAGADVNQRVSSERGAQSGDTALMDAVAYYSVTKDISAIKLLLDFKANPNDRNELGYDEYREARGGQWEGYSVLCYAAKQGFFNVVKLLLEYGADPTLPRTDGQTAYDLAIENKHPKTAALVNEHVQKKPKASRPSAQPDARKDPASVRNSPGSKP